MQGLKKEFKFLSDNEKDAVLLTIRKSRRKKFFIFLGFTTLAAGTALATTYTVMNQPNINRVKAQIKEIEQKLEISYAELRGLQDQVDAQNIEIGKLEGNIKDLNTQIENGNQQIISLKEENIFLESEIVRLQQDHENNLKRIEELKGNIATNDQTIIDLNGQVTSLANTKSGLTETIEKNKQEIKVLNDKIALLLSTYDGLISNLAQNLFSEKINSSFSNPIDFKGASNKDKFIKDKLDALWKEVTSSAMIVKWNDQDNKTKLHFLNSLNIDTSAHKLNLSIQVGSNDYLSESLSFNFDYVD